LHPGTALTLRVPAPLPCLLSCPASARKRADPAAFPPDPERKLDTFSPRLLFCVIHFGQFLFALHRLNGMGLLPTHASDWLSSVAAPVSIEHAAGAL
jgi:hypothetical protein